MRVSVLLLEEAGQLDLTATDAEGRQEAMALRAYAVSLKEHGATLAADQTLATAKHAAGRLSSDQKRNLISWVVADYRDYATQTVGQAREKEWIRRGCEDIVMMMHSVTEAMSNVDRTARLNYSRDWKKHTKHMCRIEASRRTLRAEVFQALQTDARFQHLVTAMRRLYAGHHGFD